MLSIAPEWTHTIFSSHLSSRLYGARPVTNAEAFMTHMSLQTFPELCKIALWWCEFIHLLSGYLKDCAKHYFKVSYRLHRGHVSAERCRLSSKENVLHKSPSNASRDTTLNIHLPYSHHQIQRQALLTSGAGHELTCSPDIFTT